MTCEEKISLLATLAKRVLAAEAAPDRAAKCELFLGSPKRTPLAAAAGVGALQLRIKAAQKEQA